MEQETKQLTIAIIDYGMGNIQSVRNALELLHCEPRIFNEPEGLIDVDAIVLPGVGAFEDGMKDLRANNLDNALKEFSQTDRPLLGICLGMQLFMTSSEENGHHDGLNIIKGKVVRFKDPNDHSNNYKIPQIGWNALSPPNNKRNGLDKKHWDNSILKGFDEKLYMYFLHSYYVLSEDEQIILSETSYGRDLFCSVFQKDNIIGCQFHPERSGEQGLKILKNYLAL